VISHTNEHFLHNLHKKNCFKRNILIIFPKLQLEIAKIVQYYANRNGTVDNNTLLCKLIQSMP